MIVLITIVHVIVCIGLIIVVLLQTGKGAEMGAAFGGGSSGTVFGSSGAGSFLSRVTTGMAVVFMLTSLTLGYFASYKPTSSVFDRVDVEHVNPPAAGTSATQAPAAKPQVPAAKPAEQPSKTPATP